MGQVLRMNFLVSFAVCSVLAYALSKPIKRFPLVLYGLACACDAVLAASALGAMPPAVSVASTALLRKGVIAAALFALVMFIGVFPKDGIVSRRLRPIRAELSIAACLLIAGHMATYAVVYAPALTGSMDVSASVAAGLVVTLVLGVLVVVLGVTSFRRVKARMQPKRWKQVQLLAYPFIALIYVHIVLMMGTGALSGSQAAAENLLAYTLVFASYALLRVRRFLVDRRANTTGSSASARTQAQS